jgi:hypothetical protein
VRLAYRVLANLIALGVVIQAAVIAYAWFDALNVMDDGTVIDKNYDNAGMTSHSVLGTMVIPLIALVLLVLSFFARIPGGVTWAAITFGVMAIQVVLAFVSFSAPIVGILHGLNAFALAAVASIAARRAGQAAKPVAGASPAPATDPLATA